MPRSLRAKISLIILLALLLCVTGYLFVSTTIREEIYVGKTEAAVAAFVKLGIERVNSQTSRLEKSGSDLASLGEIFYTFKHLSLDQEIDEQSSRYLVHSMSSIPGIFGASVWYESFEPTYGSLQHGLYVQLGNQGIELVEGHPDYDRRLSSYYEDMREYPFSEQRYSTQRHKQQAFWLIGGHSDFAPDTSHVMTLVTPIYHDTDIGEEMIGITSIDWLVDNFVKTMDEVRFTADSELILMDENFAYVMGTSLTDQKVTDEALLKLNSVITNFEKNIVSTTSIELNGKRFDVFYSVTDIGMIFASLVPVSVTYDTISRLNTIDAVAAYGFGSLLVLALYILLLKYTNPIKILTNAVRQVANGDMSVVVNINSNDEFGVLASGFNQMTQTLALQKEELELRNTELEERVQERTKEVKRKNTQLESKLIELERLNKTMIGRELKMIDLKSEIKKLKQSNGGVDFSETTVVEKTHKEYE